MENILSKLLTGHYKRISFLGLGKSNISLLSSLPLENTEIVLRSEGEIDEGILPTNIKYAQILKGKKALSDIENELVICSPSVRRDRPELESALERGAVFTSDAELFFDGVGEREVFAVSGSDGKSTTTAMLAKLLCQDKKTALVGNIGTPMLNALSTDAEAFATELSSFMLSYLSIKVKRAAITNITPNHLNWHKSFEEYRDTKLSLLKSADEAVISADDEMLAKYANNRSFYAVTSTTSNLGQLKKCYKCNLYITYDGVYIYRNGIPVIDKSVIRRAEIHNIKNLMTALALAHGYYTDNHLKKVAHEFTGLSHRAEPFFSKSGCDFIDSSIDTTPERTRSTLLSLGKKVILILCGIGKGTGYDSMREAVALYAKRVIVCGRDADDMIKALNEYAICERASDFASAVRRACALISEVEAVLLSPAATSYDEFQSFEHRGIAFQNIVKDYFK